MSLYNHLYILPKEFLDEIEEYVKTTGEDNVDHIWDNATYRHKYENFKMFALEKDLQWENYYKNSLKNMKRIGQDGNGLYYYMTKAEWLDASGVLRVIIRNNDIILTEKTSEDEALKYINEIDFKKEVPILWVER